MLNTHAKYNKIVHVKHLNSELIGDEAYLDSSLFGFAEI